MLRGCSALFHVQKQGVRMPSREAPQRNPNTNTTNPRRPHGEPSSRQRYESEKKMSARTRASRAEHKAAELTELLSKNDRKFERIQAWIKDMQKEHHPEISGRIDLSICSNSNLRSEFLEGVGRNLYCRTCRNPWPCKTLQNVRALKDVLWGHEYTGLPRKSEKPSEMELPL